MADLVERNVTFFGGKIYVHHAYSNGHVWMIVASEKMITARLAVAHYGPVHRYPREHRMEKESSDHTAEHGAAPPL